MNSSVFITDGHWRKSLAAVRALGTKGIKVTVGESTCLATALFSRYCNHAVVYPSPFARPSAFLDFLHRKLSRHPYQMLLPMEDETLELISRHHSDFSRLTYLPIVSFQKLHLARCKDKILRLADTLGIPTPKTWFIKELSDLESLKNSLPYPVVIKPKISSGAVGIAYPKNPGELLERYLQIHEHFPFPMIQEYIPSEGPGYGASFLMDERGDAKASFVHKRIREYPVSGGASTLRKSVKHHDIRDLALTLLKALDWFGVAMVEFKLDPRDGLPKLMEINPRFWGSLSLAVAAGVNFPYLLYRMSQGENFKPIEDYQTEKKCRWLLPGDILHFIDNPHRSRLLPEFFHFWDANTTYDILSIRDPLPALARCLTPLTFIYNNDMKLRLRKRRLLQNTQT
ncbi:carboxylate--amine ligase [Desulfobacteraceae bacterium SEEP-SAG9]|nr:carboxylate--amine ligase [Desulfobacteraceae bacterium SEEP-SAG9]